MIEIDGSIGGGQVLRTALSLSMLTLKPFRMTNIRSRRSNPGLQAQHIACVRSMQAISDSFAEGDSLGSTKLVFEPRRISKAIATIDVGTAGSVTLVAQCLIPACLFSAKTMRITLLGGTDVPWSPSSDYLRDIFLPRIREYALIEFAVLRRGYYPAGQGRADLTVHSVYDQTDVRSRKFRPILLVERGTLVAVRGVSHASVDLASAYVAQRQSQYAERALASLHVPVQLQSQDAQSACPGSGITLAAYYHRGAHDGIDHVPIILGSDCLGKRGMPSEDVAMQCAHELLEQIHSGAAVDGRLADQLIPYLGIFGGELRTSRISDHARSNIEITQRFLGCRFSVDEKKGIISCVHEDGS